MHEITLPATVENVETVTAYADELLTQHACSLKAQRQLDVAIDELFGNIAQYAYGDSGGEATVSFAFAEDPKRVIITFSDSGTPYNPLEAQAPDLTLSAEERPIGGLGILLVRKTMDRMSYRFENGKNILEIEKVI